MFSTPKASTADIDCNGSHLPHESGLSQGKQGKGRRRKNNKLHNNSTLSVAVLQSSLVPVSPSSELSDNKLEELPWDIPSQERSCSPATPLPTERTVFDAFTPLACPPDGSCTLAKLNDNVQSTTPTDVDTTLEPTPTGPITPRSRPKPSPIATKALHRSTSLSHSATINSLIPEPNEGGPHSSDNSAGNIINEGLFDHDCPSGRDSGIAIDSWGPSLETDKDLFKGPKDPFPSFDQLFQPSDFGTDPFQAELVWEKRARQRCRSMVHPSTLRHQSSSEDHLSRSDIELSTLNTTSTNKSGVTKKVRSKRVASMSFVSGPDGTKHFADMLSSHHDLPPKPPTNGANCSSSSSAGTKSSFFHTPHSGDSSQGRDQAGYFNKQHNRSTSLSSSSRSSSVSGTIPLSRSPSPPIHHPNVMPFSSMLDLATAKAENITGLYFAKQMNMKSVSCLHPVPQGLERSISDHSESDITIKVNSPSPIANAKHAKEATEVPSLRSGPLFEGQAGKAIAWFESAGKCSIRGLQSIINVKPHGAMDCPLPKKLSGGGDSFPDNELADMLRGDHMATSGPFAPYLPAILCLSLLCRQGVQTREGDLVLKKDQAQAVELLKDLVGRAPPSLASRNNSTISSGLWTQEPVAHSSFRDMHETWAVTLSQHLLKTWTSPKTSSGATCPPPIADKTQQRILRHHLLYITNPTHGKNLYNLGVLYDLYLQDPGVAVKCYRTAYHNSVNPISTANSNCETSSSANLVTRINSSWNLGVLHVKNKEWQQAQEWFLRAQQDVHLYENVREKECVRSKPVAGNDKVEKGPVLSALEKMSEVLAKTSFSGSNDRVGEGQRPKVDTRTVRKRSLVNVVPHDQAASPPLPSDSPARIHAREHGLMMHLGSLPMPGSSSTSQRLSNSKRDKSPSNAMPTQNKTENREGIRTDANKISWVLRWVESNMNSSK
ncbi:hypothetical protein BGZ52_012874 [Haplosporangium bisporale]|nr:hypothetical protein BGZ52_012874 [Haplosporangium bisporale]